MGVKLAKSRADGGSALCWISISLAFLSWRLEALQQGVKIVLSSLHGFGIYFHRKGISLLIVAICP